MVFFLCFLCEEKSSVKNSKPAAGLCSRCGGGASVVDVTSRSRVFFITVYSRTWRAIMCTFCGAVLKSYR